MPGKLTLFYLISASFVVVSCHKSNSGGGNSGQLAGTYQFLYLTVQVQQVAQESGGGLSAKTVTNTSYKTVQNTGMVIITKDSIATKGVGYTANANTLTYIYEGGVLQDSISMPFSTTIPAYSSASKYDLIGKDSIYIHGGNLVPDFSGGSTTALPSGGRYSFKADTLFITERVSQTSPPQNSGGVTVTSSAAGLGTIVLLKQ